MNKDMKETVLQAVDYTNTEAERTNKRTKKVLLLGVLCWAISSAINHTSLSGYSFVCNISAFAEGAGIAFILLSIVLLSRYGIKISEFKKRLLKKDL